MTTEQDPAWKQAWKTQGIRYLGKDGTGHIDHMDRFEHAWNLAIKHCEDIVEKVGEAIKAERK
jgi:hypothetical protein